MPIIRNLRKFSNVRIPMNKTVAVLFPNYARGETYPVDEVNAADFPEPLTGYTPSLNGSAISSSYWGSRGPENAYQDDLLIHQTNSDATTHSPSDDGYTGFIFNEPTVSTVFVLKPGMQSGTTEIHWPHRFYVTGSNDGVNFETISPEFTAPYTVQETPISVIALYDINPDKKAFTEYRLEMDGNTYTQQYIDALYWY